MFNDVLTSSKGPGVIGSLLALLVLGGFSGLSLLVLNSVGYEEAPIEVRIKDQLTRLDDLSAEILDERSKFELYRERQNRAAKQSIMDRKLTNQVGKNQKLKIEAEAAVVELDAVGEEWSDYKGRYRVMERAFFKGKMIDLSETHGEGYKAVKVSSVSPIEMRLMLSSGPKGIAYETLPKDLQDQLQFDADEANAYRIALGLAAKQWQKKEKEKNEKDKEEGAERKAREFVKQIDKLKRDAETARAWVVKKKDEVLRHRDTAKREQKAVRSAKNAGRVTMGQVKVTQANALADAAERASKRYSESAAKMDAEVARLRRSQ